MKVLQCALLIAMYAWLTMMAGDGMAQGPHGYVSHNQTVAMSEVSYQDIMARLATLEAAVSAADAVKPHGGWEEVDMGSKPTQRWTGRVHLDYWSFPHTDAGANYFENDFDGTLPPGDRMAFRRLRLGMKGNILGTMEYKIEFDFAKGSEPAIKDAYIGWNDLPLLHTVLVGNQKRPYGLDHLSSSRYNVFMERPFVVEAISPDARRLGLCSYGLSDNEAFNWRLGFFFAEDIQTSGGYIVPDDKDTYGVYSYQAELSGRFANTIWYDECSGGRGYAHWAVSGAYVDADGKTRDKKKNVGRFGTRPEARTSSRWIDTGHIVDAEAYQMCGVEGVVNIGRVQCVGEYMNVWLQRYGGNSDLHFHGGYVYLSYFLTGEHVPWSRFSGTIGRVKPFENFFLVERCSGGIGHGLGAWQLALRYSHGDFTDDDIYGGVGNNVTLGLNWWWTPYSRLQFNAIYGDIEERWQDSDDHDASDPISGEYTILGVRFAADF